MLNVLSMLVSELDGRNCGKMLHIEMVEIFESLLLINNDRHGSSSPEIYILYLSYLRHGVGVYVEKNPACIDI